MTRRLPVWAWLLFGALVGLLLGWTIRDGDAQPGSPHTAPTIPPPPTVSAPVATSSTLQAPGSTTKDPNTFTTGTIAGPIQVRVPAVSPCQGHAGGGYRVTYTISNSGPTRTGPVTVQLDLQPPIQPDPAPLTLHQGQSRTTTVLVPGTGELVTVTWQGRTSFPMDVESCQPNPADSRPLAPTTTR